MKNFNIAYLYFFFFMALTFNAAQAQETLIVVTGKVTDKKKNKWLVY